MQKLIIYLEESNLSQISWILTDENKTPDYCLHGGLEELTVLDKSQISEVIAIAPPPDVLLTTVTLPKLNRQRLLQALPFALEDQLLTEVIDLHFAIGNYAGDTLPVAIVAKQKIAAWLAALKELGLTPAALIPAPLAIRFEEYTWNINLFGDSAIIRTGWASGFTCDNPNLATLLTLKLAKELTKPNAIHLNNYTIDNFSLNTTIPLISNDLPEKNFLTEFSQLNAHPTINLLQGTYQTRRKTSSCKKIWLRAMHVTAASIALVLFGNLISIGILHHQSNNLQTAINKIYKQQFPEATTVSAPKQRMAEKLNQLLGQNHRNELLIWLAKVGSSLTATHNITLKQFDFHDRQLRLAITTAKITNVDAFTQSLLQQGLTVKQQNMTTSANQTTGTLLISDGSTT